MTTIYFTNPGLNTWVVPADWNNTNNTFWVIGAGGPGTTAGGGGGGYASGTNFNCVPGSTIYINVGPGGITPKMPGTVVGDSSKATSGGNSWINIVTNSQPINSSQGVLATGGGHLLNTLDVYVAAGQGLIGNYFLSNGGRGYNADPGQFGGGGGAGAGGPHGNGSDGGTGVGGAGDAGLGGAGGSDTGFYLAGYNGQNGPNNGAGGGGSYDSFLNIVGAGGLFGGGHGGNDDYASQGAQGICTITYTPYVAPQPVLPPPPSPPPPPACVPSGILTATPAQIYWLYGSFSDLWNNVSSAHYDSNYQKLLSLTGDNDTGVYDSQYNDATLPWYFQNEKENFFLDYPRIWKSRSNEWIDDAGQKSIWMRHRTQIGDSDCVPNIDNPSGYVTLLSNLLFMDEQTYGYRLAYANSRGYFLPGDIVTQTPDGGTTNISGTVFFMDPNYIYINFPIGTFLSGYTVQNAYNPSVNAFVTASVEMNEKYSANVFPGQSRYICKQTTLPSKAEDLQAFMTAYRPANTNFKVYGKIIAQEDSDNFKDKIWSRLSETSNSTTLYSSLTNDKDYISIMYDTPQSQLIFSNLESCSCNTTSLNVTVPTNIYFAAGEFVYLTDPSTGAFNVRKIGTMPNNTTLALTAYPSFSNTANLNVGVIPGLEDVQGAFRYDQHSNIIRYVNNGDIYFDMFDKFAIKIVPISDNPVICPTVTEFRGVALAAS